MQKDSEKNHMGSKTLIICRDLNGLKILQNEVSKINEGVIIISDDPLVHKTAKDIKGVINVFFLEKMESYYCVANDVITIIRQINQWLEELGHKDEIPKDLLYWVMHCEGGNTSQRVLDTLLLIRSYQDLIDRFNPHDIILIQSFKSTWEDELLLALTVDLGIKLRVLARFNLHEFFNKRFLIKLRPLVVGIYLSINIIKVKFSNFFRPKLLIDDMRSVIVQLVGPEKKHLNHSLTLLKAINSIGLQGITLGWRLGSSAKILRQERIAVVEIETLINIRDLVTGWYRILKSWSYAKSQFHYLLVEDQGVIATSLIRGILIKSMRSFYLAELFERYCLKLASDSFFQHNKPKAFRPHSLVLPVGVIPYRAATLHDKNLMLFIQGGWPYNWPEPITEAEQPIPRENIVFCSCGYRHKELLLGKGFLERNIEITGLHWIEPIQDFKKIYTKNSSRDILQLKGNADLYILLDVSNALRGYCTSREQHQVLQLFIEFASQNTCVQLIIKPHPSCVGDELHGIKTIIKNYALENITVLDNSMLPYHAINSADILVTKLSTLAVEAMFLDVPTLAVVLDSEINFMFYQDAVEYYTDLISLEKMLSNLLNDKQFRENWYTEMAKRQLDYFLNEGLVSSGMPATKVAEIVASRLKLNIYKKQECSDQISYE